MFWALLECTASRAPLLLAAKLTRKEELDIQVEEAVQKVLQFVMTDFGNLHGSQPQTGEESAQTLLGETIIRQSACVRPPHLYPSHGQEEHQFFQ